MVGIKQFFLIQDTETTRNDRFYFSDKRPKGDSPQKLIAVVEMNVLHMHLDYDIRGIWKIVLDL